MIQRVHAVGSQVQSVRGTFRPRKPTFGDTGETGAAVPDSFTSRLQNQVARDQKRAHLNELLWTDHVSDAFVRKAYDLFLEKVPEDITQNLLDEGYSIVFKELICRNRPDLNTAYNYSGGLHLEGERAILIAEYIIDRNTGEQKESLYWQNALLHEIGHRVAFHLGREWARKITPKGFDKQSLARLDEKHRMNLYGITESTAFRDAYLKDYYAMPEEMRALDIKFAYFTTPRIKDGDPLERARQETFAEAFDILLRGRDSSFNYENFTRHLPRTLAATYRIIRAQYPDFQAHASVQDVITKDWSGSEIPAAAASR